MNEQTNPPSGSRSKLSRRHFLGSATLAAATPLILPALAKKSALHAAPGERINLGFIGMGHQNRSLLNRFIGRNDTQVVAVSEVDQSRLDDARQRVDDYYTKERPGSFKGCAAYKDFRDLLARKDIDAVVIATPDHWHAIQVIQAAEAGKDIYCEKPLSITIREAKAMTQAVRDHDRVFQTGSMQRSSGRFLKACELVMNGRIGKVQEVEVRVGGPSRWCDLPEETPPVGLDWDMWLGPAPYRGWCDVLSPVGVHNHFPRWRNFREYAGGGVTDWGAHHFDIAQWGLGMDDSGPVEVHPPDGKDYEFLTFVYANGVRMLHKPREENGILFKGTEGNLFVNRSKLETSPEHIAKEEIGDKEIRLYKSTDHYGDFLNSMRTRKPPICDVSVGARTATVCHLANLAYWYNRSFRWDPEKQRFDNDAEANMFYMDIDRRDPWKI